MEGDGQLAAKRFLGDEGRPLSFSKEAILHLKKINNNLILCSMSNFYEVFTNESVYLGKFGGYVNDVGANSIKSEDHLFWAKKYSAFVITENIVNKFCLQFDRQAIKGKASAEDFYAEASSRLASYGFDLGDPGANNIEKDLHLNWAKQKTIPELRDALKMKVRLLMAGASDNTTK